MGPPLKVLSSGAFRAAYLQLVPKFQAATGCEVLTAWGGSVGYGKDTIPTRLKRGEAADVVISSADGLDHLVEQGWAVAESRAHLARCGIGAAVRAGAPMPDIGTVDGFKRTLLRAGSIAISTSASGVYLNRLFERLAISEQIAGRVMQVQGEPVGAVVARGGAQIGFQQMSELLPIDGIELAGPLPADIQEVTVFAAAVATSVANPRTASRLIEFLCSPDAAPVIRESGMEPA
jgi:molybdate transport system substrate-binding protein